VKPTPKKKVETPIPAAQAKQSLKVKTYVEKLELRVNELELILEDVVNKLNRVADRMGL
jgi:hypothetical protein